MKTPRDRNIVELHAPAHRLLNWSIFVSGKLGKRPSALSTKSRTYHVLITSSEAPPTKSKEIVTSVPLYC